MDSSIDTNNLLEMAIELQSMLYINLINDDSIEAHCFYVIDNMLEDYIKHGSNCDKLIDMCINIRSLLNL